MSVLDKFNKKEEIVQKTIEIECEIFEKVEYLSNYVYDATISKIINECIDDMIKKENIKLYPKKDGEISTKHSVMLRKSTLDGLGKLRKKYRISTYKLIDIAIRNVLNEIED